MIKNTIYYRFSCENKKYKINFDTTEISIGDIKKEIIHLIIHSFICIKKK